MNRVLAAKRTKLFELKPFRVLLLVLVTRVVPTAASRALKFYEFSHNRLSESS